MSRGITLAQFYLSEALRVWLLDHWDVKAAKDGLDPDTITPQDIVQHGPSALRETKRAQRLAVVLADYRWLAALESRTLVNRSVRKLAYRIVPG